MVQPLNYLKETASQTAGPYVHIGLIPRQAGFDIFEKNLGEIVAGPKSQGERIIIEGRVIDGGGIPVKDALIEIWQANAAGRYHHDADRQNKPVDDDFRGWGRAGSDFETGLYRFRTIKPGSVVGRRGHRPMAPHVNFWIVARGINIGLNTRMYFSDEDAANAADPVLNIIEPPARRNTLVGQRQPRGQEVVYTFDIHLQGEQETVFFDV
jgi:protocatechuate 3,4-dioxygenase alpha subunit